MPRDFSIAGVCERDIDLLLLEELRATPEFGRWFGEAILGESGGICVDAARSVTSSEGESDLEADFRSDDGAVSRLLIENKIGANFQPAQAERYRIRGGRYVANNQCARVFTVLLAPAVYLREGVAAEGFDRFLAYEAVRDWFLEDKSLGVRGKHKAAILTSAIEKGTIGYQMVEDEPVTRFWRQYWELAIREAPELEMRQPPGKASKSGFVTFRPAVLREARIRHKLSHGNVDLEFAGMGNRLSELRARFGERLESDMSIERTNKSGVVRIRVPRLSTVDPFEDQIENARAGLRAAQRLLAWLPRVDR